MKDNKKTFIIGGIVVALIVVCIAGFFLLKRTSSGAKTTLETYMRAIKEKDYDKAYETIANQKDWKKSDFIKRIKNIYTGINMKNMKVEIQEESEKGDTTTIQYTVSMNSIAGKLDYKNKAKIVKNDNGYQLHWDSSQILPGLKDDEKVTVQVQEGIRGSILDRNGVTLATQGIAYNIGFIAGNIDNKEQAISVMATSLGMDKTSVENKLNASWVQDGMFVPIKEISSDKKEALSAQLNQIDGASIQKSDVRTYPYGDMLAHVTGYVQNISAEELKKHKDEGYDETSIIGKDGLEQLYEKDLKPSVGYQINVINDEGALVYKVLEKACKNGKDITTTIDVNAQQALYDQLKDDAGAGVMMDTHTGEVLAMVSTPSYDPNAFVLGMSSEEWDALSNHTLTPLLDRTTSVYSPGSTFKAITGAIGINTNTIQSDTVYEKTDKWQKDKSWGDNYVTTTKTYNEPSDLLNAYINSDNIYFAQLAVEIGKNNFSSYLDTIGFNKSIDFPLSTQKSSYGKLANDQKLAAAGYGQGDLLISPLHLTSLYTAYKNDGTIIKPYLIYNDGKKEVLTKQAYKKETARLIFDDLKATMDSFGANPTSAAGKTGTAQVKQGEEEIGWICTVNDRYAMTFMVDNTKDIGQSHYVIPKAQNVLAAY